MTAAADLDDFWVHTVTVHTLTGPGGMGDTFATAATAVGFVDDKRRLVRGADANQVISEATYYGPIANAAAFTPGSLVDLPSGRTATVIVTAARTAGPLDLPEHVEAALT